MPLFASAGADVEVAQGANVTLSAVVSDAPAVDFSETEILSFGGAQDANAEVAVEGDGEILHIQGNGWKAIDFPYTVTEDTILEFEFQSNAEGEIHAIGFDSDNDVSADRMFQLHGTQSWGNSDVDDYEPGQGWQKYHIRVGDHFTGDFNQLVFANDHDVSGATGESQYRNVRVYQLGEQEVERELTYQWEQLSGPDVELTDTTSASLNLVTPDLPDDAELVFQVTVSDGRTTATDTVVVQVDDGVYQQWLLDAGSDLQVNEGEVVVLQATYSSSLKFDAEDIESFAGDQQDINSTFAVEDDGTTLHLQGNGWKKIDLPYSVTDETILEFDFRSDSEGEIHGIGFDTDNSVSPETTFQLSGSQDWGLNGHDDYDREVGEWQHYRIRVGDYFTGDFDSLVFVNDHDVSRPDADSLFSNLRVYEESHSEPEIHWVQVSGPAVEWEIADGSGVTLVSTDIDADEQLVFQVTIESGAMSVTDMVTVSVEDISEPVQVADPDAPPDAGLLRGFQELNAQSETVPEQSAPREFDWSDEVLNELHENLPEGEVAFFIWRATADAAASRKPGRARVE